MKRLIAFIVMLAWPSIASALPVITDVSGTLAKGSILTINGSGFGTKGVAGPLGFDNAETGTLGALYTGPFTRDDDNVTFSNAFLRTNSTRSIRCAFETFGCGTPGCGDWASNFGILPPRGLHLNRLYIDAWYYLKPAVVNASRNHKIFRIHSNTYSPNSYLNIYCDNSTHFDQDGTGCSGFYHFYPPVGGFPYFRDKWSHIQGYFESSSPNAIDGTVRLWVDAVNRADFVNAICTHSNGADYWDSIYLGNYMAHDDNGSGCGNTGDQYTFWDDAYIDTTQAHVEIGDGPTYNGCTQREIQVASSWSAASVNITLNQGGFGDFAGKYLYVTDRNGAVNSSGFPLTGGGPPSTCSSGGGGGGPPPNVVMVQTAPVVVLGNAPFGLVPLPSNPAVGDYIIVCVVNGVTGGPMNVSSVTDNLGNTYSNAGGGGGGITQATRRAEIWYAKNATNAPCTVTVTMSGNTDLSFTVSEFSGLASSLVVDAANGLSGTGTTGLATVSTSNANDLVVGVLSHGNVAVALTPGSGYTQLAESEASTNMPIHSEYQVFTAVGLKTVDVALGGSVSWMMYAAAFKAAP